jgi:group II intron reverse transcriptase/maturase
MLEEIIDRRNIERALVQVESNKGASGIDGMDTEQLRIYLNANWKTLRTSILQGNYVPSAVRKVEIPKPNGGKRMLGIPTVIDRMLQQAIAQWMQPKYDPLFSERSFGFRPGRNAHQAVLQAQRYLAEGKVWVVELDLEKFFDKVNHDKLMSLLSKRIADKRTLKLIRNYLTSGIMEGGVVSPRTEGTPQGSPLSPLLSNIILDELDKELEKRKHSFVRYADDASIYVTSEAAAKRVMANVTRFIEVKLRLKVNREKTRISKPYQSTLLGYSFGQTKDESWSVIIAKKSADRVKEKCKMITKRNNGLSEEMKIAKLAPIVRGWVNYFILAKATKKMKELDSFVRTRLRMGKWKQWKTPKARERNLRALGGQPHNVKRWANSSVGCCRLAQTPILKSTLSNNYYLKKGYIGFLNTYLRHNSKQPSLF